MSPAFELLRKAFQIADMERLEDPPRQPTQASLRRAISTAYYALFHLLVDAAVNQWPTERHRSLLARTVEHKKLKRTCEEVRKKKGAPDGLIFVAQAVIQLQQQREIADYDNSFDWSEENAWLQLELAGNAYKAWIGVVDDEMTHDFLLEILMPVRRS